MVGHNEIKIALAPLGRRRMSHANGKWDNLEETQRKGDKKSPPPMKARLRKNLGGQKKKSQSVRNRRRL